MKKTTKTTTTVTLEETALRSVLARTASEGVGEAKPSNIAFDVGPPLDIDGYEIGSDEIVRSASVVIPVSDDRDGDLQVVRETTVELDERDMREAVARHVAETHGISPAVTDVTLTVSGRVRKIGATITTSSTVKEQ